MLLLLFTAALFSASAQKTKKAADRFAGLDAQLEKVRQDWKAAGFAVAVVEKDRIVYSKGFGYRNWEEKLPVTTNTLFAIGSVTKSFTSSLIGLLQKDGKVDYDKPAHSYLPALSFYNDALNNDVTLRHMMSHQTGLPRHDFSWYFFPTSSRDSMLQRVRYQEPTAGVRARWQYNNFMFTAQGVIAEKLMSKSWEDAVRTSLLQPLGMTQTNFSISDLEKSPDASLGYGLRGDSAIRKLPYHPIDAMGPAGSINSSVTEMAAWLTAWINGGKYKGKEVLPLPYVTEAITPQAIVSPGLPSKEKPDLHFSTYGFGWMMSSYRGHYRVEHGGNIDGFSPPMILFIESITAMQNFLVHTEKVDKLGVLDWLFNTPSNHRVHHASNPEYIDKNLGGITMLYDHLFGTYAAEKAPVVYGITHNIHTHNPASIIFHEFVSLGKTVPGIKGLGQKLRYLFSPPV